MSIKQARSPFDRLRQKFEDAERRCRQCGFVDSDGGWRVRTSGDRVSYQHVCPSCDAIETRELRL